MNITPFKFKHFNQLIDMLESNNYPNIETIQMKTLPKHGYIALLGSQPVAAGFLRRVEPTFAQIDTLVSNRFMGAQNRHEGISKVVENLLEDAKRLQLTGVIAHTNDEGVLKRAAELGFHIIPQTIIGLKL
jgi:hypothetical protein